MTDVKKPAGILLIVFISKMIVALTASSIFAADIPKTGWSLVYVDSEELVGEDGAAVNAFDGDSGTLWHTQWLGNPIPTHPHEIIVDLGDTYDLDGFSYEPFQTNGRIIDYEFFVGTGSDGPWSSAAAGALANDATIKSVPFAVTTGRYIRLVAYSEPNGNPWTSAAEIGVSGTLSGGNPPPDGVIDTPVGDQTIQVGDAVDFTGTGGDPDNDLPLTYLWQFGAGSGIADYSADDDPGAVIFNHAGTFVVTFTVTDGEGDPDPTPDTRTVTVISGTSAPIPKSGWSLVYVDSEELVGEDGAAVNAFDGDSGTLWHTQWLGSPDPAHPHEIIVDLGDTYDLDGFSYEPFQLNGRIIDYEFYVGMSGSGPWTTPVASGALANDATIKAVPFAVTTGRYIRLVALSEPNGNAWTSAAEIGVTGTLNSSNPRPDGVIDSPVGDRTIQVGDAVDFAGTGSDPDNDLPLTYLWQFGAGSGIADYTAGDDPGAVVFNNTGTFTVTFTVTDSEGDPDPTPDTRVITVVDNPPPDGVIDTPVGDQTIQVGDAVDFSGTGSDPDNDLPLTYLWQFGAGSGIADYTAGDDPSTVVFNNTGTFTVTFTVTDSEGDPDPTPDTRVITVVDNPPPDGVIDTPVGDRTIQVGESVDFSGTGSDPDNDLPLTYLWQFGAGSGIADYTAGDAPGAVIFNNAGTFVVTFTVTDGEGDPDPTPDTRVITVIDGISAPIPKNGWSLVYVDSEELVGEDGAAVNAFDDNASTFWHTQWLGSPDPAHPHEIIVDLGDTYDLDGFSYEPYQINGRIIDYEFYVGMSGSGPWTTPVASGVLANDATIKTVPFAVTTGRYIRLVALSEPNGNAWTSAAEIGVTGSLNTGNLRPNGVIDAPGDDSVVNIGQPINFMGSGSDPDGDLPLTYLWQFGEGSGISDSTDPNPSVTFTTTGTFVVALTVSDSLGLPDSSPATRIIKVIDGVNATILNKADWSLRFVDSEELVGEDAAAIYAFDDVATTFWHTQWFGEPDPAHPHDLQIDLGSAFEIDMVAYLPRQDGSDNGRIADYEIYVSSNGVDWYNPVAAGTYADDATEKRRMFPPVLGQFVRLVSLSEVNGNAWASAAEISVEGVCETPSVRLIEPLSYSVQDSADLFVRVGACLNKTLYPTYGIRILIDGGLAYGGDELELANPPYAYTFTGLAAMDHDVEVYVIDGNGDAVPGADTNDQALVVGTGGDYYVAIGDSITVGEGDDDPADDVSVPDGRNSGGGFTPILNTRLTANKGYPHTVAMEGVAGDESIDGLARLPAILARHPHAEFYLVLFGTNDAGGSFPLDSGLGMDDTDPLYSGTYKDYMQQIIDLIQGAGKQVYLAKVPYSLNASRNQLVVEYNQVIDELRALNGISVVAPDLYAHFEANPDQLSDNVHPNGEGYSEIANLWIGVLP